MTKDDIVNYLKILGGLLIIFPLVHVYFALDHGLLMGGFIALCVYIGAMLISIPMFNYLQYGIFFYWISDREREYINQNRWY